MKRGDKVLVEEVMFNFADEATDLWIWISGSMGIDRVRGHKHEVISLCGRGYGRCIS